MKARPRVRRRDTPAGPVVEVRSRGGFADGLMWLLVGVLAAATATGTRPLDSVLFVGGLVAAAGTAAVLLRGVVRGRWDTAVEIRPDGFTRRPGPGGRADGGFYGTVPAADVTRMYAVGGLSRLATRELGPDGLWVKTGDGRLHHLSTADIAVPAVELDRLIRDVTGLTVPGRPDGGPRRLGRQAEDSRGRRGAGASAP